MTIVVLASMVFVLSAMVGYLYWQQTRMLQHLQSLAIVISTHVASQQQQIEPEPEPEPESEKETKPEEETDDESEEDDRVSVKEEVEQVTGPPAEKERVDVDDLQDKTAAQLREMLTKKGIPFGKRDAKPVLIQLLKATA